MKRWTAFALAAGLALPAAAGDKDHRCTTDTQTCLSKLAGELKNRGWTGIELDGDKASGKLTIKRVVEGGPAEAAGLKEGDVLVAINGVRFSDENEKEVKATYKSLAPGATAHYTVSRDGAERQIAVTLGAAPQEVQAQWVGAHMLEQHAQPQLAKK